MQNKGEESVVGLISDGIVQEIAVASTYSIPSVGKQDNNRKLK